MNVTWLGQSGYLLEGGGARIAIDPYLSDAVERAQGLKRLIAPPLTVSQLAPDHLLITHDHLDHFDPDTVSAAMKAFPACRLAGPASVMAHGARIGIAAARLVPLDTGAAVRLGDVEVAATPARHSDGSAVGLLVRSADALLWFSGDTLYVPEMAAQILRRAGRPPDAAFVCMNGRLGNMGVDDAVRLVAELRPAIAVPSHYGMFAENTADPAEFVAACARAGLAARVLEHGRCASFVRPAGPRAVPAAGGEGRVPPRPQHGSEAGADNSVRPTTDVSSLGRDGGPAVRGSGFREARL